MLRCIATLTATAAPRLGAASCRAVTTAAGESEPLVVVTTRDNGVASLELNAPASLNALTVAMGGEFTAAVRELSADEAVRAVVVTGRGRAFSAGGDLAFLHERTQDNPVSNTAHMMAFYRAFLAVRDLPVPVIAAINGHAVGAGCCFALAADMRLVHDAAKVGFNFVRLGLHPGMGCTHTLPALVGPQRAARLLLSGDLVSGAEAVDLGLANELVTAPEDPAAGIRSTFDAALALAADLAANTSPEASRTLTRTLRNAADVGLDAALAREADCQAHSYASLDFQQRLADMRAATSSKAKAKRA
ncbi:enoyl-CoA hydratase/isomerase [Thecamonas trahens ATCC 50062]|uniref:Enoyl-CoA hydratase/isomerase n=1 Tax=Thecamonas trahens ATCC 50062 TaxID=461836 RepID=A0A0L0DJA2_THETB|nr:enoyl-CoA hydratase/isomerase [Thecamonas trahens ATCC 50062]KNC52387.1 enoyl-CoA hydratase/isomerase [Thecamonas trahens ATCC 50062]|eukprot:XP_013755431.1 enoyl-CoA hydratase/isomerase [Thecamonas trahens ATCC 50062]